MENLSIHPASKDELNVIADLADRIWHDHYVPIIGAEQVAYMLNLMYSREGLEEQIANGQVFYLVSLDDQPIGFISISEKSPGNYFLHKFYIDTAVQGTGLGSYCFKKVFGRYERISSIRLTVNRQNYKAINFYFKLGFRIEAVKDFDIGKGYFMNDFVMLKSF